MKSSSEFSVPVLGAGRTVTLVSFMGDDLEPLRAARMSTQNPTGADVQKDDALRDRLWRDKHTSPWESNVAAFEVVLPLFVLRQFDRHRTVGVAETKTELVTVEDYDEFRVFSSRNEFSARYSQMPDDFYLPPPTRYRAKSVTNKQASGAALDGDKQAEACMLVEEHTRQARERYERLLQLGVASEMARLVLPMNQITKVRLQAALPNWFRFLQLRLAPDVQEETRLYAEAIAFGLSKLWPKCWAAFEKHTLHAVTLNRDEREAVLAVLNEQPYALDPAALASARLKLGALS